MPTNYKEPKVGDLVYEPFAPKVPGKVIEILGPTQYPTGVSTTDKIVRVKWLNGVVTERNSGYLNDFGKLVSETERKLKAHKDRKALLDAL